MTATLPKVPDLGPAAAPERKNPPRRAQAQAAAALRIQGKSVWQIADILMVPDDEVQLLIAEGLANHTAEDPETRAAMRNLAQARLEVLLGSLWDMANDADDPQFLEANSRAQSIIESTARLLGLNAPAQHVIHSPELSQIGDLVRQITGVLEHEADPLSVEGYDVVEAEILEEMTFDGEDLL